MCALTGEHYVFSDSEWDELLKARCAIFFKTFYFAAIFRIILARAQNTRNLSHIHGTRTLALSWMRVKSMPDGGQGRR